MCSSDLPVVSTRLWVGTDVGVYRSEDGGASWFPYTTGMPVAAVFDMDLQASQRILRVGTHGRGMYERLVDLPVATQLSLVGAEIVGGHPRLTWYSADGANEVMHLYRRAVPGDWERQSDLLADAAGMVTFEDVEAQAGRSYEYRLGLSSHSGERYMGQTWVDVPEAVVFALRANGGDGRALHFAVRLPRTGDARLELLDIAGRRVQSLDLSSLSVGEHTVSLPVGERAAGIYWARLSQGDHMLSTKVAVVR